jgi:hypothetical protein
VTLKHQGSWPLVPMLPIAAISVAGQVQSRSSSRVRALCSSTGAVALRPQTALTGSDRPWTIPQREHGHPAVELLEKMRLVNSGPTASCFSRQTPRRWRRRSGSASGSEGVRAESAGRLETAVLARKRQPQHGSSETLAAALPSGLVIMADAPDYSAGGEGRRPSRSSPRSS